jgi:hypothetical protein
MSFTHKPSGAPQIIRNDLNRDTGELVDRRVASR